MIRWLSAPLFAASLLCAPVAFAQQIIVPAGGGGAACTVSTTVITITTIVASAKIDYVCHGA